MTNQPLNLPDDFNPDTLMLAQTTEYGVFHETRKAARLATALVANGTSQDIALAERILAAVLHCQEGDDRDPHYGNFYWMREDEVVEDLNAVEFVLESLIPMMIEYGQRLSAATRNRVLDGIRLGLAEIRRLDVLVAYTNITVLDILNTCLGGELLGEASIAERGYAKLVEWMAYTNRSGHPFEYNSPTYTAVTLRALKRLVDWVQHEETRIRAKTMAARLALSTALHIHRGTGRWAGPHGRAYHPSVVCETPPEAAMVRAWIVDGTVPAWIEDILDHRPANLSVTETAERRRELSLTTYQTPTFALGVASRGGNAQANVCIVHYQRERAERPGVLYTRYILNDKWFGDSYHATDRTKTRNLLDEGDFYGVQQGNRAIGLYTPSQMTEGSSAKTVLIWTEREQIDEIWLGDRRVEQLPAVVAPEQVVVLGSGAVYMAARPLTLISLGREAPLRLSERDGDLILELYNYSGPFKRFWEMRWPGAFFQGRPLGGFYLEVVERQAYESGRAFGREVAAGILQQNLDSPFTYPAEGERSPAKGERLYSVSYQREGQTLGLEIDLMAWRLKRRWTEAGEVGWPMLESPLARETDTGQVEVGEAMLRCGQGAAWLAANPAADLWVAGYFGPERQPFSLTTPRGTVNIPTMGTGVVVFKEGRVSVEAIGVKEKKAL